MFFDVELFNEFPCVYHGLHYNFVVLQLLGRVADVYECVVNTIDQMVVSHRLGIGSVHCNDRKHYVLQQRFQCLDLRPILHA